MYPSPPFVPHNPSHRSPISVGVVRVSQVGVLASNEDGLGDVGTGIIGVEGDDALPVRDGGGGVGAVIGCGDGEEEVLDEKLQGWRRRKV